MAKQRKTIVKRDQEIYNPGKLIEPPVGGGLFGKCFNPTMRIETFRPQGVWPEMLMFRPLPYVDPEDTSKLLPGRIPDTDAGDGSMMFSPWFRVFDMHEYAGMANSGCKPFTYILGESRNGVYHDDDPFVVLRSAVQNGQKAYEKGTPVGRLFDPSWIPLLGSKSVKPVLKRPVRKYLIRAAIVTGFIYEDKKDKYVDYIEQRGVPYGLGDGDPTCIVMLSSVTGNLLTINNVVYATGAETISLLNRPSEKNPEKFKYPDPVGEYDPVSDTVKGGLILGAFMPGKNTPHTVPNSMWFGEHREIQHSVPILAGKYVPKHAKNREYTPTLTSEQVTNVINGFQYWNPTKLGEKDGIVYIPTMEERCEMVVKGFSAAPKMIQYGWSDHPQFMQLDCVKAALTSRVSSIDPRIGQPEAQDDMGDINDAETVADDSGLATDFDNFPDSGIIAGTVSADTWQEADEVTEKTVDADADLFGSVPDDGVVEDGSAEDTEDTEDTEETDETEADDSVEPEEAGVSAADDDDLFADEEPVAPKPVQKDPAKSIAAKAAELQQQMQKAKTAKPAATAPGKTTKASESPAAKPAKPAEGKSSSTAAREALERAQSRKNPATKPPRPRG